MTTANAPIGVFDSGIGGLSILKALRAQMPRERFVYFADSAHTPYGPKGDAFVIDRSRAITQQLIDDHGIKALVIACNTATAAAIAALRAEHPSLPIIGVEPALKPAVAVSRTKRIAVLATQGTLQSDKFLALKASLASQAEFICIPGHGLAEMIERSVDHDNTTDLIAKIAQLHCGGGLLDDLNSPIDTLVLGCTHYPLVLPHFQNAVGQSVTIVDNGQAVARQVAQRVVACDSPALEAQRLVLLSSDSAHRLPQAVARWQV